jgi:hypothetical protein
VLEFMVCVHQPDMEADRVRDRKHDRKTAAEVDGGKLAEGKKSKGDPIDSPLRILRCNQEVPFSPQVPLLTSA